MGKSRTFLLWIFVGVSVSTVRGGGPKFDAMGNPIQKLDKYGRPKPPKHGMYGAHMGGVYGQQPMAGGYGMPAVGPNGMPVVGPNGMPVVGPNGMPINSMQVAGGAYGNPNASMMVNNPALMGAPNPHMIGGQPAGYPPTGYPPTGYPPQGTMPPGGYPPGGVMPHGGYPGGGMYPHHPPSLGNVKNSLSRLGKGDMTALGSLATDVGAITSVFSSKPHATGAYPGRPY